MAEFKIVISDPGTGKTSQKEVKDDDAKKFMGLKIGDKLKAPFLEASSPEVEITGGSDYCGFPMRKDVLGTGRKRVLIVSGVGTRNKQRGIKKRKTVCGNTVHSRISQINVRVVTDKKAPKKEKKAKPAEKETKKPQEKEAPKKNPEKKEEKK